MQHSSCVGKRVFVITLLTIVLSFTLVSLAGAVDKLPQFSLLDPITEKTVKSETFAGKVILITFFTTWCPPCRTEVPSLIKLQDNFKAKGFSVLGISLDEGGPNLIKRFVELTNINYPILMANSKIQRDFGGITGIPTSFLIDRNGKVVERYIGYIAYPRLEKDIKSVL